jgi:hypothetical protein
MVNFFIERGRRHRSSKFFFLYHQSSRIVSKMGKCWKHCQFPLLPVEASQHRCFNGSKKIHAFCSSVRHPRADELGLGLGSDILCPTCAGYLAQNIRHAASNNPTGTPFSANTTVSDDYSVSTNPSTNDLLTLAERAAAQQHVIKDRVIEEVNIQKKQQLSPLHSLPPGVTLIDKEASGELKCQFTKQYKCKYKNTALVFCANDSCTNPVHVQMLFKSYLE